ncbi:MAG: OmpA family protein [Bacteroidales bacterium]|nr:OmpA family protein [Bacteroidales bacterium]MBP5538058.1 OmpA family protein [Bacteroidales bacterium]
MKKIISMILVGAILFSVSGCASMNQTGKGSLIGAGAGAAVGAGLGAIFGKDGKSAAIGAAIGTAVGTAAGAVIGKKMDQKAEELAKLEGASVETITDANGLEAIKVTFESGILFPFNGVNLSDQSKATLAQFANEMRDLPETNITIWGHTDNIGTAAVNQRISGQRADAVKTFLNQNGIANTRLDAVGKSFDMPVADNATEEGRAQNRRVEIYVSANENMIRQAEAGQLQ